MTAFVVFGDWHLGRGPASTCVRFARWVAELAREHEITRAVHLGDWFDRRRSISPAVMAESVEALSILRDAFERVDVLAGNHDLCEGAGFLSFLRLVDGVRLHTEATVEDGIAFLPWGAAIPRQRVSLAFCHMDPERAAAVPADVVVCGHAHAPVDGRPFVTGPSWPLTRADSELPLGCAIVRSDDVRRVVWPQRPRHVSVSFDRAASLADLPREEAMATILTVTDVPPERVDELREILHEVGFASVEIRVHRPRGESDAEERSGTEAGVTGGDVDSVMLATLAALDAGFADGVTVARAVHIYRETARACGWRADGEAEE